MKLKELASRISAHLKRIELEHPARPWYQAGAWSSGSRVFVCYVAYQGPCSLTKAKALAYLAWLDQGGIGKHYAAGEAKSA